MTKQALELKKIEDSKQDYMELLLLADEQEDMIMKYLDRGTLFAAYDENLLVGVCVVTEEKETYGAGAYEIKNLAVKEQLQRRGYAESHRVKNFFTDHYDHPIVEAGVVLRDMVYLKKII